MSDLIGLGSSIAGGLISGIGSIVGGNKSAHASKYAADKQYQAQRETNAINRQIAQENNAFNERMWNAQNEYNSALNQRKRLEQAGLNPYLMLNGGSAGTAESAPTADTSGTAVAPDIGNTIAQGGIAQGNSITSAAQQIAQFAFGSRLQNAQASNAEQDALYKSIENEFAAALFLAKLRGQWTQNKISDQEYYYLKDSMKDRLALNKSQLDLNYSQQYSLEQQGEVSRNTIELLQLDKAIKQENLKWLPQEKYANFRAMLQNIETAISQQHLNEAQAKQARAMAMLGWAQENGIRIDNYVKDSCADLAIGIQESSNNKAYAEADQYRRGFNLSPTMYGAAVMQNSRIPNKQPKRSVRKSNINTKPYNKK